MISDMLFRHPDDGSGKRVRADRSVADGITPDEWLSRQIGLLMGQYANMTGLAPGFEYDLKIHTAAQVEANNSPVYDWSNVAENAKQVAMFVSTQGRPMLMNLIGLLSALHEMSQWSTLDQNLKDDISERLNYIQDIISNMLSVMSGIDMSLLEVSNMVLQRTVIARLRNGNKDIKTPGPDDVHEGHSSDE